MTYSLADLKAGTPCTRALDQSQKEQVHTHPDPDLDPEPRSRTHLRAHPHGRCCLWQYLSAEEFESVFKCTKEAFNKLAGHAGEKE